MSNKKYSNRLIYKMLKIVDVLCIITLVITVGGLLWELFLYFLNYPGVKIRGIGAEGGYMFYVWLIIIPIGMISPVREKKKSAVQDRHKILGGILFPFFPQIHLTINRIFALFIDSEYMWERIISQQADCRLLALFHCLLYIAEPFLVVAFCLIGKEKIFQEEKGEQKEEKELFKVQREERAAERILKQKEARAVRLMEKCGVKFFIKYYHQIKNLPLRDVEIEENYSTQERQERLMAAKKIIDLNLVPIGLNEVLKTYGTSLAIEENLRIRELLTELSGAK